MNKDIKKYKKKRDFRFVLGMIVLPILSVSILGAIGGFCHSFLVRMIAVLLYGSITTINILTNKHWVYNNVVRQLEFREKLKDFNNEEKEIVKEYIKKRNIINYKNNSISNININRNIDKLNENINLVKNINSNPKIVDLLDSIYLNKYDSIENLSEALTTSNNVPADVIYKIEKLKTKRKIKKINNKY